MTISRRHFMLKVMALKAQGQKNGNAVDQTSIVDQGQFVVVFVRGYAAVWGHTYTHGVD